MKYITALIMFIFIMSPLMTEAVHAAKPADKEQALPVTVDVTPPVPTTIPLPTTVQNPPPSPIPTKAPVVTPIAEPTTIPVVTPTAAPTPIPSPAPVEVSKKEKEKDIMVSIGEVISHLGDAPTPTPTPQAVQVAQASIARAVPAEKKVVTASPAKKIQQFIEPSATFFLHTIPGNYYLVNSLSKTQSASLLLIAFLLVTSGSILLYNSQRQEIARALEAFISTYLLPFWTRNKDVVFTIFDRDYAK